MSLFKELSTQGLEESSDRLGGFQTYETDIYPGIIKNLYAGESTGGAMSLTVIVDLGGKEYRETIYITTKEKKNFFINKSTGKKAPLPGFTTINDICLITTGQELNELETEEKVVKVWDFEAKAEVPKSVQVITAALGKPLALGIIKQLVNKNEKQGSEYVPTAETREENVIDKVFHPELKVTVAEARQGKQVGEFWDAWLKKNQGNTRDRREIKDGVVGAAAKPGAKPTAATAQAPRKSLFGK